MKKTILLLVVGCLLIRVNVFAEDVLIDGSGNVETGVSSPLFGGNLDVTGTSGEHAIFGSASGTFSAGIYGESADSGPGVLGTSVTGIGGYFLSESGYGLIVGSGNVGIGTETPQYNLDVTGTIKCFNINKGKWNRCTNLIYRNRPCIFRKSIIWDNCRTNK